MGKITLFFIFVCCMLSASARSYTPRIHGLVGGAASGLPSDSVFGNPAAVAFIRKNAMFFYYSRITKEGRENSRGQDIHLGMYDAVSSKKLKGAVAYSTSARDEPSLLGSSYSGRRKTWTGVLGTTFSRRMSLGARLKYVRKNDIAHFYGDVGGMILLTSKLNLGLTLENIHNKLGEESRNASLGLRYDILGPLNLYLSAGRKLSSVDDGNLSWSVAGELTVYKQFIFSGGVMRNIKSGRKGHSIGLMWNGPRTTFEYTVRTTTDIHTQYDHVGGIRIVF